MQQKRSARTNSIGHQTEETRGPMSLPRRWLRVKRSFARMNILQSHSWRCENKKTRLSISTEPGFYFEIRCSELVVRDQPVWTSFIDVVLRSRFHRIRRPYVLIILRKEVIQPQVPLRLPCYDFIPITSLTLGTRRRLWVRPAFMM